MSGILNAFNPPKLAQGSRSSTSSAADTRIGGKALIAISAGELKEYMTEIAEIQKNKGSSRKIIQILKIIEMSTAKIESIEFTQAEKFLRHLIYCHDCDPFHPDKQDHQAIKATARSILLQWSEQRRQKLIRESKQRRQADVSLKIGQIRKTNYLSQDVDLEQKEMTKKLLQGGKSPKTWIPKVTKDNQKYQQTQISSKMFSSATSRSTTEAKKGPIEAYQIDLDQFLAREESGESGYSGRRKTEQLPRGAALTSQSVARRTKPATSYRARQTSTQGGLSLQMHRYSELGQQITVHEVLDEEPGQSIQEPTPSLKPRVLLNAAQIHATGYNFRNTLRQKLVDMLWAKTQNANLANILKLDQPQSARRAIVVDMALRIENQMFKLYQCGKPYNDKSRSIIYNLSDEKNLQPLIALVTSEISPEEFVTVDMRKLVSDKAKKDREEAELRGLWNKRTDWDQELVKQQVDFKGMFKCTHCNSDRTGYIQIQIERADEPMTNFVFCYDCQHRYQMEK